MSLDSHRRNAVLAARTVDAERLVAQIRDCAIIALDTEGHIETWNAGAQRLKGYTPEEALGRHFSMFYTDGDRELGLPGQLLGRALRDGSVEHTGWRVRRDGTRFWGDVIITALTDDDGRPAGFAKVTRDRTAEHQLQSDLNRSRERLRLLVEQVDEYAIIALDGEGHIETWNAGAQRLKGYTPEEALGRHFSMFYTDGDRELGLPGQLLGRALRDGSVEHTGWRVRRDGTRFWGDVIITALTDDDGRPAGFAKVTRDLTSRKSAEDARARFIDMFAHDFRGPLHAVAGYAELLDEVEPAQRTRFVERIQTNARRLNEMTIELVEHSRLRTPSERLDLETLSVTALLESTVGSLVDQVDAERILVDTPALQVVGNLAAMQRVLANLVGNALKYSPLEQSVSVSAVSDGDTVRIIVRDHGRGIDPRDLPTIFDEFERGRLADDEEGSGLGLASVQELTERQGGQVSITSELGIGTTVTITLPSPTATV